MGCLRLGVCGRVSAVGCLRLGVCGWVSAFGCLRLGVLSPESVPCWPRCTASPAGPPRGAAATAS